jgi:hypothetical protein
MEDGTVRGWRGTRERQERRREWGSGHPVVPVGLERRRAPGIPPMNRVGYFRASLRDFAWDRGPTETRGWIGALPRRRYVEEESVGVAGAGVEFEEALELADAGGMAHFAEGLGFDLADALAGDVELAADFLEGAGIAVAKAEAEFEDAAFAGGKAGEDVAELVFEEAEAGDLGRAFGALVFDEVAEAGVVAVADGGLEGDGLLGHLEDGADAFDGELEFVGEFVGGGFAAEVLDEAFLDAHQFVDGLDHVDRDADGAGLIGDGACDGLADPPCGVGGEFVAAAVFEFFDGFHEAHVAFLDEVEEGEAAVGVFFGDGDDEAEVGLDHLGLGLVGLAGAVLELFVGVEEILVGHAYEVLEDADLEFLGVDDGGGVGGGALSAGFVDEAEADLEFVADVFGDESHLLDDLLFAEEFVEGLLELLVGFFEGGGELVAFCPGGLAPAGVVVVHVLIELADVFDEFAEILEVAVAVGHFFVHDDAVEAFLGGLGEEFFGEGDVLLAGEAEAVDDLLEDLVGFLDALGDGDFLLAGEEGDLAHLLEVHADGIVEDVEAGAVLLFLVVGGFDAVHLGLVHDFDIEAAELDVDGVEFLGGDDVLGEGVVDVAVSEIALLLGEADEVLDFVGPRQIGTVAGGVDGGSGRFDRAG